MNFQANLRGWTRRLALLLGTCLALLALALPAMVRAQDGIAVERAELEYSDGAYRLVLAYTFRLTPALEDALSRGVPLYFTTEVQLTRPRWYWLDEKAVRTSSTTRLSYNVLTQQYQVTIEGGSQQNYKRLDEALHQIRQPPSWHIANRAALKSGEVYELAVRMGLDVARLPKPIQVHAINSSDWRFSSDWKQFSFRAE